jgi:hypothetical protein
MLLKCTRMMDPLILRNFPKEKINLKCRKLSWRRPWCPVNPNQKFYSLTQKCLFYPSTSYGTDLQYSVNHLYRYTDVRLSVRI